MRRSAVILALLAGCAQMPAQPRVEYVHQHVPSTLLVMPVAPVVPAGRDQASAARFLVDLWQAQQACRAQVAAIGEALGP